MTAKTMLAATALVLSVSAGRAFAGEGNGDPFPSQANAYVVTGPAFMADTGSAAYPQPTSNRAQPSSLAQLEPAPGSEALIQTVLSLPRGAGAGPAARAQPRSVPRNLAARSEHRQDREAGEARPRS